MVDKIAKENGELRGEGVGIPKLVKTVEKLQKENGEFKEIVDKLQKDNEAFQKEKEKTAKLEKLVELLQNKNEKTIGRLRKVEEMAEKLQKGRVEEKEGSVYYDRNTCPEPSVAFRWERDNNNGKAFRMLRNGTVLQRYKEVYVETNTFSSRTLLRPGGVYVWKIKLK